jgi:hypothetical protein
MVEVLVGSLAEAVLVYSLRGIFVEALVEAVESSTSASHVVLDMLLI